MAKVKQVAGKIEEPLKQPLSAVKRGSGEKILTVADLPVLLKSFNQTSDSQERSHCVSLMYKIASAHEAHWKGEASICDLCQRTYSYYEPAFSLINEAHRKGDQSGLVKGIEDLMEKIHNK